MYSFKIKSFQRTYLQEPRISLLYWFIFKKLCQIFPQHMRIWNQSLQIICLPFYDLSLTMSPKLLDTEPINLTIWRGKIQNCFPKLLKWIELERTDCRRFLNVFFKALIKFTSVRNKYFCSHQSRLANKDLRKHWQIEKPRNKFLKG